MDGPNKKTRYSQLTSEQRLQLIQRNNDARRRRQTQSTSNRSKKSTGNQFSLQDVFASQSQGIIDISITMIPKSFSWDELIDKYSSISIKAAFATGLFISDHFSSPIHELRRQNPCNKCGAMKFEHETPTFCCQNGQVQLAETEIPDQLYDLFAAQTHEGEIFRKNVRGYNSIFSFTSFGVNLDKSLATSKKGVYTFRVQGQTCHDLPALLPDSHPIFFQLYFYDTAHEIQNRTDVLRGADLDKSIIQKLISILQNNPYARFFRSIKDQPSLEEIHIHIASNVKVDQRVYNTPTVDQVAAIWIEGNNHLIPFEREIVVHAHSGRRHKIQHYFSCYDSLQYPLLFPNGEAGWHQDIRRQKSRANFNNDFRVEVTTGQNVIKFISPEELVRREAQGVSRCGEGKVSCREYYCYKLQIRPAVKSILLLAGRLLQQYVVDMYIKLETTRLDFYTNQQSHIRSELYQGIVDTINAGETRGDKVGKRIVLPATFIGGPRYMRRRYLDAMALVQHFGKPDIFLTVTCNSDWKEIRDALLPGQRPQDRPDLTSRVFKGKLMDLKDQILKKEIFGKVAAFVYVIEFQKRGLPHAHILIILQSGYKITSADHYDKFVSAEIPERETNPYLFEAVVRHMLHGPCGKLNQKCPCMVNGSCRFHYPRPFSSVTVQGKDAYPIYQRRNNGVKVQVRNATFDNRWVVPYNPYLLVRYNCHINVEICSGLKAVKYLYKYIYKGHDRAAVHISHDDDSRVINEIRDFQDARWVSAQEALWRIYEFQLNEISPAVITLQLHLPNQHSVSYWEKQDLRKVVQMDHVSRTMLTEFFEMCKNNEEARKLLYREFPKFYVWNKQGRMWTKRKRGEVISRIASANPGEGERYYERLLLNHVRGPRSFEDLMNVDGTQYWTFKGAAQRRGLLESDQSIIECLEEASTFQLPVAFRRLFATILVHCDPTDVRNLWDLYFETMSDDFRRDKNNSLESQIQSTLHAIQSFLQSMGKDINAYDLPILTDLSANMCSGISKDLVDEMSVTIPDKDIEASRLLNEDQKLAYNVILDRVLNKKTGVFFVDGPGGTGKTFLYRALLAEVRCRRMIALASATSGVAASILPGGRTAHSRFNIPLQTNESSICNISKQSGRAEQIRRAELIIWDEAPMAKRTTIEAVDRTFQDIMGNTQPFGGKVMVFGGDFRQVLPVVPWATRQQTVNESLAQSYLWKNMEKLQLKQNMRAKDDQKYAAYLLNIGNGTEPTVGEDFVLLPREITITSDESVSPELKLISSIYGNLDMNAASKEYITQRAILSTTNEFVDQLNELMIERFPGDSKEFFSFDEAVDDTGNCYQEEFLNTLLPNGIPPHRLLLKKHCPIMLLRNLDPSNGLCNGSRLICHEFTQNLLHATIATGEHSGKSVFIPRIPLSPATDEGYPFKFIRKQFPIRLCFAITINKAQGQTIQNVGVYLPQHVFSHGQLYVALSRGISMEKTKVLVKSETPYHTKNIVYKEVLM